MAKASIRLVKRERVLIEEAADGVNLSLDRHEASVLRAILRNVGGNPETTDRRVVDAILYELGCAGITSEDGVDDMRGKIYF